MPVGARVLAIDPGAQSGWCYLRPIERDPAAAAYADTRGRWLANVGTCDVWSNEPVEVVQRWGPVSDLIVVEMPGGASSGKFMKMIISLSATIGVWRWAWRTRSRFLTTGPSGPELGVVQVSWRSGLLGGSTGARESSEWKRASLEHARLVEDAGGVLFAPDHAVPGGTVAVEWDAEKADAFGLAWWAVHSPQLVDALGARWCKTNGWDDQAACLATVKTISEAVAGGRARGEAGGELPF